MLIRWVKILGWITVLTGSQLARADAPPASSDYVPPQTECSGSDNGTLAEMFRLDQADRKEGHPDRKMRDAQRKAYVLQQLSLLCTPGDHHHAAMILQHSNEPAHHLLAHRLARYAADQGHKKSRWLSGAAWDRYFVSRGLPQYFGSQFKWNKEKQLCLIHVDPQTTDEDRVAWDQPPIAEIYSLILKASELSHLPPTPASLKANQLICAPHVWADWAGH